MEWTHENLQTMGKELKTLNEENKFQETVIKDLNTNLSRIWEEFYKKQRLVSLILEEQQTVRRDLRDIQHQKEIWEKEVGFLYEKEDQEENFFPQANQGDKPITKLKKVKEEEKSENRFAEYMNPWFRSESIYQDGENLSYTEKQALKKLPEVVNWPKISGIGEYYFMELIYHIDEGFVDFPNRKDYWITTILNTVFRGHENIWNTKIKEIHGRKCYPWWRNKMIQKYRNGTWIWKKATSFESERYSTEKGPYELCLEQTKRFKYLDLSQPLSGVRVFKIKPTKAN
ncbi:hypothetical protein O181_082713 [Austropuccinia psidii MF-1]|uniref:Uncharacterized protein n=1 Tax=Austropuccinia psidii MF-1 TaxID=1389203 RepID=A0A9Q3FSB3_9BASI|nr:hypothetical protein [Austropuccinia psidii MF-1]